MRLLLIATGYLPYLFSENLCNGKLVYALKEAGIEVDVISKSDLGPTYSSKWEEPWINMKSSTFEISYNTGSIFNRYFDTLYSGYRMGNNYLPSIRWARRAYEKALELISKYSYDAILTRSPGDISHLVGYYLKKKTGIKWIANWNDPADPIWPIPYKHNYNKIQQISKEKYTCKLLRSADLNTFPSDSLRQHFFQFFPFLKHTQTDIIPHIGLSETIYNRCKFTRKDKLYLCHSGNLSSERNPELTFKAMKELINEGKDLFQFDIMGRTNDLLSELINKYNLHDYVRIIGSYNYLDAMNNLSNYDVLVLLEAQLDNGIFFASKFTDYAQTGRPIFAISPKLGFAKTMINKYNAGIAVDNTDYLDIKFGLETLITMWETNQLSTISSDRLYSTFSADSVVKKYKDIINKLS